MFARHTGAAGRQAHNVSARFPERRKIASRHGARMKAAKNRTDKMPPAKVSVARAAAFEILRRVTTEDAYASNLLAAERYDRLGREDRALLNELVLGVLRQQGLLDFLIERYAQRPLSKLDPEVVIALRLGLYQLNFLARIPAHAAINEAVNQVRL